MDLSTTYLGMPLKNPLVPSASPLSQTVEGIRQMEDAGAAAVVMHSLFEEQLVGESQQLDHFLSYGTESGKVTPLLDQLATSRHTPWVVEGYGVVSVKIREKNE